MSSKLQTNELNVIWNLSLVNLLGTIAVLNDEDNGASHRDAIGHGQRQTT